MVQWLRCHAPNAGPGVPSLVRELDPTCCNPDLVQPNKYFKKRKSFQCCYGSTCVPTKEMLQFWPSVLVNAIFLEIQPLQMYLLINYDDTIRVGCDPK